MKTLAFLSVSPEMGGSEAVLVELATGLRAQAPHLALHAVVPRPGPLASRMARLGVQVHVLPMPAALARFGESAAQGMARRGSAIVAAAGAAAAYRRDLRRLLHRLAPDVVHSNGLKMHVLSASAVPPDAALVWHVHEYVGARPFTRRLMRHYVRAASAIVANSASVAADLRSALGTAARIRTVLNGIDLNEFSPDGETADLDALAGLDPAPPGTIRIGLPATFGRWKGHRVFLAALGAQPSAGIRGYVIGGPLYDTAGSQYSLEEMRALARAEAPRVTVGLTGFVERPARALRALDIVVHASTQPEPFGLVIAEAMACGRPTIVSAAGGAAEIVRAGTDALTHAPGDVEGLARAMALLAADAGRRADLAEQARRSAVARFDGRAFARGMLAAYEEAATRVVAAGERTAS